jgi:phage baseplate assembly protein W
VTTAKQWSVKVNITMAIYKGFSTFNRSKKFRITDFELVKQDLINHFNIRKGEKLMNPDFGTIIWDSIFEPLNEDLKNLIMQDVKRIIANDPRISAQNVIVTQYEHGLQIEIDLLYISSNKRDVLTVAFDQRNRTVTL